MIRLPKIDLIEYLVCRKFHDYHAVQRYPLPSFDGRSADALTPEYREKRLVEIASFQNELEAKKPEEINTLYAAELTKEQQERAEKSALEEKARFFNQPNAQADFSHWSKAAHWTLDEAIALSFGKAPEVVNWISVMPLIGVSPFALKYSRIRDLAKRSVAWRQLYDPVLPGIYLAWARRTEIDVPEELLRLVEGRGIVIADWKDLHDQLQAKYDKHAADGKRVIEMAKQLIEQQTVLRERIDELETRVWNGVDTSGESYSQELDIAVQAWRAVSNSRDFSMTVKEQIIDWIQPRFKLSTEAIQRIAVVCNWEKEGGRRKRE